jgi:hypothetical protein
MGVLVSSVDTTHSLSGHTVDVQIRCTGFDDHDEAAHLHLQGKGPEGNRSYGIAIDFWVPAALGKWLFEQDHPLDSLAETKAKYVPVRVHHDVATNEIRFQVTGTKYNRPYGAAFAIAASHKPIAPLVHWLTMSSPVEL